MTNDRTFSPESIYNKGFAIEITWRTYIYFTWLLRKQAAYYKQANNKGANGFKSFRGLYPLWG